MQAAALETVRRCGKISALLILDNFQGWKREGGWGDVSFLIEHDIEIVKIAVVGDEQWRILSTRFSPKAFAKPRSNISFRPIWQKRASG